MRKVIGIGETVLDIIFRGHTPIKAVPGGSAFNAIISIGRMGVPAAFISETGNDRIGLWVREFLEENNVNAKDVCVFPDSKSPLSLAFLDEQNNAEYLFYKDHPHDRIDFQYPEIHENDIVIFGSFFAINPAVRPQVAAFLDYAHQKGAILYYDLNYRSSHKNDLMKVTPAIIENLELSDIVRGSDEDFEIMYKKKTADEVYHSEISFYTHNFIYTQGSRPVELRAEGGISKQYEVKSTATVVSTIGAGDNFNAGLVYGLIKYGITRADIKYGIKEEQWDRIIDCAMQFSAEVCGSMDNYVSNEFASKFVSSSNESATRI